MCRGGRGGEVMKNLLGFWRAGEAMLKILLGWQSQKQNNS